MRIGIGIDTGGTYTDAVIYDFEKREVLGQAKSLTTKNDLSIGIIGALDGLPPSLLQEAEVIALSTTLATNACVENKGGRAKLIFFGGDVRVIDQLGGKYGLPSSQDILLQKSYTTFSGEMEKEPDWELFRQCLQQDFDFDGIGIVEMNAMHNSAQIEKKAKAIFEQTYSDVPVVCGHELFSHLNCLQRGASTLLNASLFPVIKDFLESIKKALTLRNISAPLVILRSDGSLMSETFASIHPVETLLCGPAASTLGGVHLSDSPNSIVIDMGGTTTDIALVKDGCPVRVTDGIAIGKWKTFVDGLYINTFGLGGDSAIHYKDGRLLLEEYRIVPLCVAAHLYPSLLDSLKQILVQKRKHSMFLYEHYMLIRDISDSSRYTPREKALCRILREKPLPLSEAAQAVGTDMYNLNIDGLLKDGVVQICGLTPTDIMHIRGDFDSYELEASRLGAEFVAYNLSITIEDLCHQVYGEIKSKLYFHIVKVLLENTYPHYRKNGIEGDTEKFIQTAYDMATAKKGKELFSLAIQTDYQLIGIGAPIGIFLPEVAQLLGTTATIPDNYQVANALGAIIGNISASSSIEIKPNLGVEGISSYTVYGIADNQVFEELEQAEEYALVVAEKAAKEEALLRGAKGDIALTALVERNNAEARGGTVFLGSTATAKAVGSVGF